MKTCRTHVHTRTHTLLVLGILSPLTVRLNVFASSRVLLSQSPQTSAPSVCLQDRNSSSRCWERGPSLRIAQCGAGALPHWLGAPSVSAKIGSCPLKIESERSRGKVGEGNFPVVRLSSGSATAEMLSSEYRACQRGTRRIQRTYSEYPRSGACVCAAVTSACGCLSMNAL